MSTETDSIDLEALLPVGPEPSRLLEARVARIAEHRRTGSKSSAAIDRQLLDHYAQLRGRYTALKNGFDELEAIQSKLREQHERLTAPPWFPAVFLRMRDTPAGRLAEVCQGNARRLVHLGEGLDTADLSAGQVVYLGQALNAVLGLGPVGAPDAGETATVERVLPDGRLALRDRDAQILVAAGPALGEGAVKSGDTVRFSRDLMLALEPMPGSGSSEVFVTEYLCAEMPQRLGGLADETEQVIALFTQTIAHPEQAARYGLTHGNTLLLHGPPGNGKTSLARAIGAALAAATGQTCRFASVKGAQLESQWVGESQRNVRELFRELTCDERPTLLFIDEVDAIGRIRGSVNGHHSDKFLNSWLAEIDGLERRQPIGIIASTNRKDLIDQALLERLSGMDLFIGRPGLDAAREIFAVHLPPSLPFGPNGAEADNTREAIIDTAVGMLYAPNADNAVAELRLRDGALRTVAARDLLSGRTIEQICLHARRSAFTRHAQGGAAGVRVDDMEEAVAVALERLATSLGVANARAMLPDLPQDPEVVAVDPVRHRLAGHRYLSRAAHA